MRPSQVKGYRLHKAGRGSRCHQQFAQESVYIDHRTERCVKWSHSKRRSSSPSWDYWNRQTSSNNRKPEQEIIDGEVVGRFKEKTRQMLARRFQTNLANRVSESQRSAAGQSPIAVRRGLMGANSNDRARDDAYKAVDDLYLLLGGLSARQGRYAAQSHQVFTEALRLMQESNEELAEDMQPYGEATAQIVAQLMAETYILGLVKEMTLEQLKESAQSLEEKSRYREAAERYEEAYRRAIKENASKDELAELYALAIWPNYALSKVVRLVLGISGKLIIGFLVYMMTSENIGALSNIMKRLEKPTLRLQTIIYAWAL
jgi:hypothetical protein